MMIGVRRFFAALGILSFCACATDGDDGQTAKVESAVVYGEDERMDAFAVSDAVTRDLAERSTAVLVSKFQIDPGVPEWTVNPSDVRLSDEETWVRTTSSVLASDSSTSRRLSSAPPS